MYIDLLENNGAFKVNNIMGKVASIGEDIEIYQADVSMNYEMNNIDFNFFDKDYRNRWGNQEYSFDKRTKKNTDYYVMINPYSMFHLIKDSTYKEMTGILIYESIFYPTKRDNTCVSLRERFSKCTICLGDEKFTMYLNNYIILCDNVKNINLIPYTLMLLEKLGTEDYVSTLQDKDIVSKVTLHGKMYG